MDGFFTPGQEFLPEVDHTYRMQQLQRRQQLADALMARTMQTPIQATSDKGAAFQALASIGQQFLAGRTQRKLDAEAQKVQDEVNRVQQHNLQAYLTGREGDEATAKQALYQAMLSRDPRLNELAKMDMQAMQARSGFKDHIVKGALVRAHNDGRTQRLYEERGEQWGEPVIRQGAQGPVLMAQNLGTKEWKVLDKGPSISITNDMKGPNATTEAIAKKVPEVVAAAQQSFIKNQQALDNGQAMLELAKSPELISGFGATPLLWLSSLGAKLGINGPEAASQTQAALAAMANNTLDQVKRLTGAITEKERPFLEMAASGKIEWTPETLQHLAGVAIAAAHNGMMQDREQYMGAIGVGGAENAAAMWPLPSLHHKLDGTMFADKGRGRVQYQNALPGLKSRKEPEEAPPPVDQSKVKVYGWGKK